MPVLIGASIIAAAILLSTLVTAVGTRFVGMESSADQNLFMHLDKELELAVGIKERAIGALRQHTKDHKCWPQPA